MTSKNEKKTKTSGYHRNWDKTTSAPKQVNEINGSSFLSRRKVTMGTFRAHHDLSILAKIPTRNEKKRLTSTTCTFPL